MPTFDTPRAIAAVIDMPAGHIEIRAADRTDTVVDVRPTDPGSDADVQAVDQVRVDFSDGRLSVTAPKSRFRSLFRRPPSVDVTVDLPTDSRVDVSGWADIRTDGRVGDSTFDTAAGTVRIAETGRLKLRTAAGDVSVARAVGHADVTTASGKVRIGEIDGTAVVKTSNGDITLGEVTGDVRLNTANGDIDVDRALATVAAKTAYGSIRVGEVVRGAVILETSFGELEVGVRTGTAAWLDLQSGYGTVRSLLDAADEPSPSDDTIEVRARTGYGDIVIRRAAPST
jgi:DUF4097 and DUF4098 domain-containing protein YvlB